MSRPRTERGRALFTDMEPFDLLESDGVTWADIMEVERQAVTPELLAVVAAARTVTQHNEVAYSRDHYVGDNCVSVLRTRLAALDAKDGAS